MIGPLPRARILAAAAALPAALALIALTAWIAAPAPAASAAEAEPTRAEYVATLEAICKPEAEASERAVAGIKGDIAAERLRLAAAKFAAAGRIFAAGTAKTEAVPRPAADAARLARWFDYLEGETADLGKIAAELRAGRTIASQREAARFVHEGNLANDLVLAFGFHYCAFRFERFE